MSNDKVKKNHKNNSKEKITIKKTGTFEKKRKEWIILDWGAKFKRRIIFTKEFKKKPLKEYMSNIKKQNNNFFY